MIEFTALIQKFGNMGEKTGWTYLEIPAEIAQQIKPNTRTSFRVKGKIDNFILFMVALLPMGDGHFIIPINAKIRKEIHKKVGARVSLQLEEDTNEFIISSDLMICLGEEPKALKSFEELPKSHQKYYSKWIETAKTMETKSRRIAITVKGLLLGMKYNEMMKHYRELEK